MPRKPKQHQRPPSRRPVSARLLALLLFPLLLVLATLPAPAAADARESAAIPVKTQTLAELAVYPQYRAPASVVSDNDSRISAEVSARITAIPVRVGETVKKNAVLAQLDRRDFELALAREEATLQTLQSRIALAEYQLKRTLSLARKNVVSEELLKQRQTDLDTLRAQLKGQQIAVKQARRQGEKCTLRAPFAGIISARLANVGELARPGSAVVQLIDNRAVEVSAQLQAQLAQSLARAQAIEWVDARQRLPLALLRIAPVFDPRARTREARLQFTADAALPGSAGELVWRSQRSHLPAELISRRAGQLGVFVVSANSDTGRDAQRATFIALPQAEEGRPVLVSLPGETAIVTLGRFRLQNNDAVEVEVDVNANRPAP